MAAKSSTQMGAFFTRCLPIAFTHVKRCSFTFLNTIVFTKLWQICRKMQLKRMISQNIQNLSFFEKSLCRLYQKHKADAVVLNFDCELNG